MPAHPHASDSAARATALAEQLAAERGFRLTRLRRRVLEMLAASDRALGAYDLLPQLKSEGLGSQPIVAYRALEFLIAQGLAHRIEGMNAFVACTAPNTPHSPVFLVCRLCRAVTENAGAGPDRHLEGAASRSGFTVERQVVEALGLCADCAARDDDEGGAA